MFSYDAVYAAALAVPVGLTTNGKILSFTQAADKPGCLGCLVKYTPGDAVRTLTVSIQYASKTLTGTDWYDPLTSNSVAIVGAGLATDSFTFISLGLPGGVSKIRLRFASAGGGAADDAVGVVLTGLPTSGVTIV